MIMQNVILESDESFKPIIKATDARGITIHVDYEAFVDELRINEGAIPFREVAIQLIDEINEQYFKSK